MPLAVMEQYLLVANTPLQVKCNKNQLFQADRSVRQHWKTLPGYSITGGDLATTKDGIRRRSFNGGITAASLAGSQISQRADVRLDVPALGVDFGFLDLQAGEGLCLAPALRDDVGAIAEVAADARKLIQPLEISHVTSPVRTRRDQSQFSKSDLPLGNTRVQAREAAAPPRSVTQ
jgi:hypothetical protein